MTTNKSSVIFHQQQNYAEKLYGTSKDLHVAASVPFDNFVGKLQDICYKKKFACPKYIECGTEFDEFVIKCEMFDKIISQGCSKNKKDAKQKAAEKMLKLISEIPKNDISVSLDENQVGILNNICINNMLPPPKFFFENSNEYGEFMSRCEVVLKQSGKCLMSYGESKSKQSAKQIAAENMVEILMKEGSILESQFLLGSVDVTNNSTDSQEMPVEIVDITHQSDFSSVANMNAKQLQDELMRLEVCYSISTIEETDMLMLKTEQSEKYKQGYTFLSVNNDNVKANLDLLRRAVFGLRLLKSEDLFIVKN